MNELIESIRQITPVQIGLTIIAIIVIVVIGYVLVKAGQAKEEFEATQKMFLPRERQPEADQIRYNKILDSIENFNETQTVSLEEYRRAKETVWKFERQTS